jgi:hypothetical protein
MAWAVVSVAGHSTPHPLTQPVNALLPAAEVPVGHDDQQPRGTGAGQPDGSVEGVDRGGNVGLRGLAGDRS